MSQAPGLSGTPSSRPLLQRRHERLLREVLGDADVAHEPGEAPDEPGGLDPPDGVDRARDVGAPAPAYEPSTCSRMAASRSRSSGVSSSPKSSTSNTGRISTIASWPSSGDGMRLTHSTASSSDLTCQTQ